MYYTIHRIDEITI